MRQLKIATLAAAVALVFAHAAQAATTATSSGSNVMPAVQGVPTLRSTTTAPASTTTNGTGSTTTTTAMTRAPSTTVDVRNQQTNAAVAATHAVGSTSAIASVLGSASASGTGTGTTSGTGTGTTSGLGATGTNGNVVLVPLSPGVPGVLVGNGAIVNNPADFTSGNVVASGLGTPVYASAADVMGGSSVIDTTVVANQAAPNGASVDRAIREVSKDRRRIGRNGQLLYTIAPRTNVDRSHEMPDDPLPYSLTGTNSTLNR